MKFKLTAFVLSAFGTMTLIACSYLSNDTDTNSWKQFRGNNRNGTSSETNINEKWADQEPILMWTQKLGSGFSEILVSKDRVFTMISEKTDSISGSEFMVAYDALNGKEIWKTIVDSMFIEPEGSGEGPRSTPAMDDNAIYCLSSFGILSALSRDEGKILWTTNFLQEFDNKPGWQYTTSPLLLGDEIILEIGGTESRGFASIDKNTGETIWVNGEGVPTYSSPITAIIDEERQMIFANGSTLKSFNKIGKEIWSYSMPLQGAIATPLFIAPNKIFVSYGGGCFLIKVDNNEAIEVFKTKSMRNTFSTSCYFDGHIYGISSNALKCISATEGEAKWAERGFGLGSLSLVGNKILAMTAKGVLKIVEASPEAYTEIESFQALNGKSWTAPSFANGMVYVRNLTEMASYQLNH
jgi:outer membrane protein assembly factor BamB